MHFHGNNSVCAFGFTHPNPLQNGDNFSTLNHPGSLNVNEIKELMVIIIITEALSFGTAAINRRGKLMSYQ